MFRAMRAAALLAAAAAVVPGCEKPRLPTVPVSGRVTYEDGSPVPANSMELRLLTPQKLVDEEKYPHAATARIDIRNGAFSAATTWEHGDGVIPGEHEVEVVRFGDEKEPGEVRAKEYRGDRIYPSKVTVSADRDNVFHITIPRD